MRALRKIKKDVIASPALAGRSNLLDFITKRLLRYATNDGFVLFAVGSSMAINHFRTIFKSIKLALIFICCSEVAGRYACDLF